MARTTLCFVGGVCRLTDTETWETVDSGGEADIYRVKIGDRSYILKVYTPKYTRLAKPIERVAEIMRRLTRLRRRCGRKLPEALWIRGLPVAIGAIDESAVLAFRDLGEFTVISELVSNPDVVEDYLKTHGQEERRAFARNLLQALACLEIADVAHLDITSANAAYGVVDGMKGVFLYDYETAGLVNDEDYPLVVLPARDTHMLPVEALNELGIELRVPDPGELPIPLMMLDLPRPLVSWITWTPVWYGLQLAGLVYAGISPFYGLPALTGHYWKQLVEAEAENGYPGGWPPLGMVDLGYLDYNEYLRLTRLWRGLGDDVVELFYTIFVSSPGARAVMPQKTLASLLR